MKRFSPDSQEEVYDLIVVGGGIYGASMAYTAALNGLKTVLLEKDDFTGSTSANSQKVIHGGLRYLQTLDLKRVVESIREKQRFFYLFPHLVKPLPCVLPTSGWGTKGNEAFRIAFMFYRLLQRASCRGKLTGNLDKKAHLLSKAQVIQHFPHLSRENIRGGALWYDGLCCEPERVVLGLLKSAARCGAGISNYTEVKALHRIDEATLSVTVFDHIQQQPYQLKSRKVALCTGASFKDDLGPGPVPKEVEELTLIRGMNVILPSLFHSKISLATKVTTLEESRFLFIVPWKEYSIGGTHWEECTGQAVPWAGQEQVRMFHGLMAQAIGGKKAFPGVLSEHVGFVPGKAKTKISQNAAEQILPHFKLIDREQTRRGDVLQVVGVKFTTAFDVTLKSLKKLFPRVALKDVLEFAVLPCGSPSDDIPMILEKYERCYHGVLTRAHIRTVFDLVGNGLPGVVEKYLRPLHKSDELLTEIKLFTGLTIYCVAEEMTVHLHDLLFRRLFPDSPELPSQELLTALAGCMAELLSWTGEQMQQELDQVRKQRNPMT